MIQVTKCILKMSNKYEVIVLFDGYSKESKTSMEANCTCTLIRGPKNIVVDTMTAWDGAKLQEALLKYSLNCGDIHYVVCTHGHSDHIGCNYLFTDAIHIVGYDVSKQNTYFTNNTLSKGGKYTIDDDVEVIPTPGHTLQHVSVIVKTENMGVVAIAGDLFEKREDLINSSIWKSAGSQSEKKQKKNRNRVLQLADWIVPGHGPMFKVPDFTESHKFGV